MYCFSVMASPAYGMQNPLTDKFVEQLKNEFNAEDLEFRVAADAPTGLTVLCEAVTDSKALLARLQRIATEVGLNLANLHAHLDTGDDRPTQRKG